MWQRFQAWLDRLPFSDQLARRQASLLATMELGIGATSLLLLPFPYLVGRPIAAQLFIDGMLLAVAAAAAVSLLLLRRGRLQASALLMALTLIAILSLMLFTNTLNGSGPIFFAFSLPIALGGVLAGRSGVLITIAAAAAGVGLAALLEGLGAPGAGFARPEGDSTAGVALSFFVLAGLFGLFVERLRAQIDDAIAARRARELELEALGRRLELSVRERTADLEIALGALEQRATEAERLVAENHRQRGVIRALSIPILPIDGRTLVIPLVGELDGQRLEDLTAGALEAVGRLGARRLLLDITGVPLVDTRVAQSLIRTLRAVGLLGAEVVLVGVRPEVAQAIVGLGIDLGPIPAYADLQSALR